MFRLATREARSRPRQLPPRHAFAFVDPPATPWKSPIEPSPRVPRTPQSAAAWATPSVALSRTPPRVEPRRVARTRARASLASSLAPNRARARRAVVVVAAAAFAFADLA